MLSNVRDVAITAVVPAVWGSTYLVTTELLPPGRPLLAVVLRALPSGLLLVAVTRRLPRGEWWWRAAVLGTLNIGLFFTLLFVAAYRLPGGVAAVVLAIQPLVVVVLARLLLGEPATRRRALASAAGLAGVAMLVLRPGAELDAVGLVAAVAGAVSMATGVVLSKRWPSSESVLATTGWQLVAGGTLALPVALAVEGPPPALTAGNLIGYAYLAVLGAAITYPLWFRGIRVLSPTRVTFLGLLSPLVASALGWMVLDQGLTALQGCGALVVLIAVLTAQTRPSRSGPGSDPGATSSPDGEAVRRGQAEPAGTPPVDDLCNGDVVRVLRGPCRTAAAWLLVVQGQKGFDGIAYWGRATTPAARAVPLLVPTDDRGRRERGTKHVIVRWRS